MINTKKIIAFMLIMIMILTITVFADWPSSYGTEPNVSYTSYPYRIMFFNQQTDTYWYLATKEIQYANPGVNGYEFAPDVNHFPNTRVFFEYDGANWISKSTFTHSLSDGSQIAYSNYDIYELYNGTDVGPLFYTDSNSSPSGPPPISDCKIYTVGIGETINVDNNETTSGFFYLKAHNATYEQIIAIGSNYPLVTQQTNVDSGEWEWMEPEPNSNYNYWKITAGYIEIAVPNNSSLVVKTTTKTPSGGYDVNPSPDRGNYEGGIFGTIAYGIDTLIYWVSYPFVAVGNMFVSMIDEIKLNLSWINDFNAIVQMLFGWIPERFQGLLFICVSATVISFIIRVFRGS